jgi:hypothetical protein
LHILATGTSTEAAIRIDATNSNNAASARAEIRSIPSGSGTTSRLAFSTRTSGGNLNEGFRLDESQRLLVGTSSAPSGSVSQYAKLSVVGNTSSATNGAYFTIGRGSAGSGFVSGTDIGQIFWTDNAGAEFASIAGAADGTCGSGDYPGRLVFSTTADGSSSPTERMRITSDGQMYLASSTPGTASFGTSIGRAGPGFIESFRNVSGTSSALTAGGNAGTARIMGDGDLENTNNRYTGISDVKLKQNIEDASSQWNDIKGIRVRKYELIAYPDRKHIGVVAQELEEICPGLVIERDLNEETGETVKSVAYSILYMKAVKALQEAMERIEVLEQRLTDAGIA